VNDRARGPGEDGAIQRAELFRWKESVTESIQNLTKAGHALIDTDTELGKRSDELSNRLDIANKRIRRLEEAVEEIARGGWDE